MAGAPTRKQKAESRDRNRVEGFGKNCNAASALCADFRFQILNLGYLPRFDCAFRANFSISLFLLSAFCFLLSAFV
jgi:hypothetical protein